MPDGNIARRAMKKGRCMPAAARFRAFYSFVQAAIFKLARIAGSISSGSGRRV